MPGSPTMSMENERMTEFYWSRVIELNINKALAFDLVRVGFGNTYVYRGLARSRGQLEHFQNPAEWCRLES